MKLEDKIEYYNENLDNPEIKKEALLYSKKLKKIGNILFIIGIIFTTISFVTFVTLTIIFIVKKELSALQLIPLSLMIIFSIMIFVGIFYKKISQAIILDE